MRSPFFSRSTTVKTSRKAALAYRICGTSLPRLCERHEILQIKQLQNTGPVAFPICVNRVLKDALANRHSAPQTLH